MKIPDILKSYCSDFSLSGSINFSDSFVESIKKELKFTPKSDYLFQVIEISGKKYLLNLLFEEKTKEETHTNYHLIFRIVTNFPADLKIENDVIKILDFIVSKKSLEISQISAGFNYPIERFNSIIPLPFNPPIVDLQNVEVKGLRVVFKNSSIGEYSHVIDLGENFLYHGISLKKQKFILSANTIEGLLKTTSELSMKLLEQKK